MVQEEVLIPTLTSITDAELVRRIRTPRGKRVAASEATLIERHRQFVYFLFHKYIGGNSELTVAYPVELDDLVQVGLIAMLDVARARPPRGWDSTRGTRFTSFAKTRIIWAIQDELRRSPRPTVSLDRPQSHPAADSDLWATWHVGENDMTESIEAKAPPEPPDVAPYLEALTPIEAALVIGVYGLEGIHKANEFEAKNGKPGSVRDMGARLGLSQDEARRMIAKALEKMRALGYGDTSMQEPDAHE